LDINKENIKERSRSVEDTYLLMKLYI